MVRYILITIVLFMYDLFGKYTIYISKDMQILSTMNKHSVTELPFYRYILYKTRFLRVCILYVSALSFKYPLVYFLATNHCQNGY